MQCFAIDWSEWLWRVVWSWMGWENEDLYTFPWWGWTRWDDILSNSRNNEDERDVKQGHSKKPLRDKGDSKALRQTKWFIHCLEVIVRITRVGFLWRINDYNAISILLMHCNMLSSLYEMALCTRVKGISGVVNPFMRCWNYRPGAYTCLPQQRDPATRLLVNKTDPIHLYSCIIWASSVQNDRTTISFPKDRGKEINQRPTKLSITPQPYKWRGIGEGPTPQYQVKLQD